MSWSPGHKVCLRNGLTVTATTDAEKCSLPFSHWSVKSIRSRSPDHSVSIKSMNRTIIMQGLTVTATADAEKCCLPFKVTGVCKVLGQGHQITV